MMSQQLTSDSPALSGAPNGNYHVDRRALLDPLQAPKYRDSVNLRCLGEVVHETENRPTRPVSIDVFNNLVDVTTKPPGTNNHQVSSHHSSPLAGPRNGGM